MKGSDVFETCHSRYQRLRGQLNEGEGCVRSLAMENAATKYQWRPTRARACEYVADFERIGRQALRRPEWKGRLKLFETYFLKGVEYRPAISAVGVSAGTFDYWFREVKRTVGAEFLRTGLFPPSRYFQARDAALPRPNRGFVGRAVVTTQPGTLEPMPYVGGTAPSIRSETELSPQ